MGKLPKKQQEPGKIEIPPEKHEPEIRPHEPEEPVRMPKEPEIKPVPQREVEEPPENIQ